MEIFGVSVALSSDGRSALIGASAEDDEGDTSGSVYSFDKGPAGWEEGTKTTARRAIDSRRLAFTTSTSITCHRRGRRGP